MLQKLERITISKTYHDRLMASNSWRGLEALIAWSDSVTWQTKAGKNPVLVIKYYRFDDFIRWKDWISDVCFAYVYTRAIDDVVTVEVPVEEFFRATTKLDKWHASNR